MHQHSASYPTNESVFGCEAIPIHKDGASYPTDETVGVEIARILGGKMNSTKSFFGNGAVSFMVGNLDDTFAISSRNVVVAIDTNTLLNIARFKVDVFAKAKEMFGAVEFVIPSQVIAELEGLAKRGAKLKKEAAIAMEVIGKNRVKIVQIDAPNADAALLSLVPQALIATNDKELKESVRELNGKVLYLRQRKFLELS
ncbi:MAG TPA: hypothetical protein VJG83_01040 [archaeon]|nr:hypothetical protein [archaeon]